MPSAGRQSIKRTAASLTVTGRHEHRVIVLDAADLVVTLPPANHATKGRMVTVVQRAVSAGVGAALKPQALDKIQGQTIAGVDFAGAVAKKLINTGASDVLGDRVAVISDGLGVWEVIGLQGVWAAEA